MATTFADLEARIRGAESRLQRTEEDVTAIIDTVVEIRDEQRDLALSVRWLCTAVAELLTHAGIEIPPNPTDED